MFFNCSEEEQREIANKLEMSVSEVKKKILDINNMESDIHKVMESS